MRILRFFNQILDFIECSPSRGGQFVNGTEYTFEISLVGKLVQPVIKGYGLRTHRSFKLRRRGCRRRHRIGHLLHGCDQHRDLGLHLCRSLCRTRGIKINTLKYIGNSIWKLTFLDDACRRIQRMRKPTGN